MSHVLDNPTWHALMTEHALFAEGNDLAKRYPSDVSSLCAVKEQSKEAYDALAELLPPQETVILFLTEQPSPPAGWRVIDSFLMDQMVCKAPPRIIAHEYPLNELSQHDVPEMIALAKLTKPGPFRKRTIEFGGYLGVRAAGCLAAMTGQRTHPTGFIEVSAVCTHPDFRGKGYARALVATVARSIYLRDEIPFLGVRQDNRNALRVYQEVGFTTRRALYVAAMKRPQ